jgi:hypothetical protein
VEVTLMPPPPALLVKLWLDPNVELLGAML